MLAVAVAIDGRGKVVGDIEVRGVGLPGDADYSLDDALDDLAEEADTALSRMKSEARLDDVAVEQAVGRALKKASQRIWDRRRPIVETLIVRI